MFMFLVLYWLHILYICWAFNRYLHGSLPNKTVCTVFPGFSQLQITSRYYYITLLGPLFYPEHTHHNLEFHSFPLLLSCKFFRTCFPKSKTPIASISFKHRTLSKYLYIVFFILFLNIWLHVSSKYLLVSYYLTKLKNPSHPLVEWQFFCTAIALCPARVLMADIRKILAFLLTILLHLERVLEK